ncbi:MAG: sodium:solute symporter family protein [Janthinobacterium lividum]
MIPVFLGVLLLSLAVAFWSRRGHGHQNAADFFVASGQFGSVLFFFLAVGETYSVATILGFPGGVYAHGTGFVTWFLGYILLAFPVGYFLNPLIWRAGRRYGAVTLPDLFARHFDSRGLELVVTLASILFLVPLGVMQFVGLDVVLGSLGWRVSPLLLTGLAGGLAFTYVAISGIRASAYVAVLKDLLMMAAILLTGLAALTAIGPIAARAALVSAKPMPGPSSWHAELFSISTILLQSVGFCLVPQSCAYIFTARSAGAVRRAQVAMPLYMAMFPFLFAVAVFALHQRVGPASPDGVLLFAARRLLPGWAFGLVMAAASLSALVVLSGICLALGPLVTRNLVPGLDGDAQRHWSKLVMALYLALSVVGAAGSHTLMVAINNLFYFGITQTLPGLIAILLLRRTRPAAIAIGLLAGDAVALLLHMTGAPVGGINPGFIGLLVNCSLLTVATLAWPGPERTPVHVRIT